MSDPRRRVAFADIVNEGWTAGAHYYKNLFTALRQVDGEDATDIVVVGSPKRAGGYDTYRAMADEVVEMPSVPRRDVLVQRGRRALRLPAVDATAARPLEALLRERGVEALFACWMEFGPDFGIPLLGWIPDFQHKHHPDFFPAAENRYRDDLFERMAANCTRIALSSEDARRDYERFHPEFGDKARVLRFVAGVPAGVYDSDAGQVCAEYHLPDRFVYLPNQFWVHKNHAVVLDALTQVHATRPEITVVCTGNPSDNRDPLHFGELLARVSRAGLRDNFVVLGWIPHADTYRLVRQSLCVLQPSLFEGWSTTVEEAKSLGKSILLSDIPIHREQDPPGGLYFDPSDASALAEALCEVYDTHSPGPDEELEALAREALPKRTRAYGETFVEIVRDAVGASVTSPRGGGTARG